MTEDNNGGQGTLVEVLEPLFVGNLVLCVRWRHHD